MQTLAPKWKADMDHRIMCGLSVECTTSFTKAIQYLIMEFVKYGIPYKLTNCGAGVKHITTKTDCCPLCKTKK
jgi:hypothetical protein